MCDDAGADNWEDVEEFGEARLEWFKTFFELPTVFHRMTPSIGYLHAWMRSNFKPVSWNG